MAKTPTVGSPRSPASDHVVGQLVPALPGRAARVGDRVAEHWNLYLRIQPICIDGAPGTGDQHRRWHRGQHERLNLPFETQFASAATLERLQAIHDQVLGWQTPLPLPTTLVIDDGHQVIGIIKGRASRG